MVDQALTEFRLNESGESPSELCLDLNLILKFNSAGGAKSFFF